jgi:Tol biopolymer transport system component/DNA-binding winged helix-turn-helix (wHTH) protein
MNPKIKHFYEFGPFRFHPEEDVLVHDGEPVSLPPRVAETLSLLLQNAGHLVEKDRLIKEVWKDAIVEEGNLNKNIFILRKALGQWDGGREYIETVPKRGYRFVGAVQRPKTDELTPKDEKVKAGRNKLPWIGVGAVVVVCAAVVLWRVRLNSTPSLPPLEVVPFTSLQGFQGYPAFSPDGSQVAFTRYEGEDAAIYTSLIGGDTPLRLTTKSGVCCPTWFPDGRQIAFMRFSKNGLSINVISALGGAEKTLYTSQFAEPAGFPGRMCDHMDWSPDGKWLVFGGTMDVGYQRITLLSLDDLKVKSLTSPEMPEYDCEPAFSPDGRRIAFERGSIAGMGRDLFVIPITGGEPRRLTFENAWGGVPAWTHDGSEIVFPSTRGGLLNLWRIPAKGGSPQPVSGIGPVAFAPSIPRRGNLLAYVRPNVNSSIWQIRLSDETSPLIPATRLISSRGQNWRPSFSPDGKRIVFESDRLGYSEIWYCGSDGANCAQLTSLHGTAGTARWSPDGRHIAFEVQLQHFYEIYVIDLPDGRPRVLPTFPNSDNGAPNWSRDGKWIYFYSTDEKGFFQLWKVSFQGGTPVRVTREGGIYAIESEDGRFVYYAKHLLGIWKVPLKGGKEELVLDQAVEWPGWALSRRGIYFLSPRKDKKGRIEFFDFATHKRTPIADVDKPNPGLALSPDGRSLLYSRNEFEDYEIMLVKNFH